MGLPVRVIATSEIARRCCCWKTVRAIFCDDRTAAAGRDDIFAYEGRSFEGNDGGEKRKWEAVRGRRGVGRGGCVSIGSIGELAQHPVILLDLFGCCVFAWSRK